MIDHVVRVERFAKPGESVRAWDYQTYMGGKGANQAVAAARLGAQVTFVGCFGQDPAGDRYLAHLATEQVDGSKSLQVASHATGAALISLDATGQNCIQVALGSNLTFSADQAIAAVTQIPHDLLLLQFEIPFEAIQAAVAHSSARIKLVNPAPVFPQAIPAEFWSYVTVVTPNEHEAEALTGVTVDSDTTREQAADWFIAHGVEHVVLTLGSVGCFIKSRGDLVGRLIPGHKVTAVDTVGAGDAFNGALAHALSEGLSLVEAAEIANRCAAISVTKMGAQGGSPTGRELADWSVNVD